MWFSQSISTLATELIDRDGLANIDDVQCQAVFLHGGHPLLLASVSATAVVRGLNLAFAFIR